MFQFLRPVTGLALIAGLYLGLSVGAEVLAVRQTGLAINQIRELQQVTKASDAGFVAWFFSTEPQAVGLRRVLLGLGGFVGALLGLRYLREVATTKMSMEMVFYLREAVYDKLQRVGFGFHDAVSSGQLINRALSDLQNVRGFVQTAVLSSLEIILIVGGYIILIGTRWPWMAVLALVPIPIWIFYILRFSKRVQPAAKAVMEAEDKNVSILTENIAGVHVVKAFATERQEVEKYNANLDSYLRRVVNRIRLFAGFTPIIRMISMGSNLSLFLVTGILIIKRPGSLNVGDFLILGTSMAAILNRLQLVAGINEQYQNAVVSARRLYEVLMAPSTVPEKPDAKPLPTGTGRVRFENVTFGYSPDKPVLQDVSFEVPGGSIVAIVGPTGAGKTTLVNLIARFYDPQRGRVLIDGMDVRDATLETLRTQVSFVFQETYLFSDTVAGNIAYGRPHILPRDQRKGVTKASRSVDASGDGAQTQTTGEIEAAARLAQAHEFIEKLPQGYATLLGERGSSLSGGQKQRLAIARAILTNPRVLILDDATASVDPETEDLIRKGMRFVMAGRTTFVIAHRISTVKQADVVIVLEEGRITQMGTHDQLMAQGGHYRDIAAVQLYGEEGIPTEEEREIPSHMDRVRDPRRVAAATAPAKAAAAASPQDSIAGEEI